MLRYVLTMILCLWIGLANASPKSILVLGDSLSAGFGIALKSSWVALLEARIQNNYPNCQVINDSTSGATTQNGLTILPKVLKRYQPKLVIIELGGNDGLRGLPITTIQNNLAEIVKRIQASHAQAILLGVRLPPNYGRQYTQRFAQVYQTVAQQFKIPLVAQFLQGVADKTTLMQADGIHPSEAAQQQMLNNVWPKLAPLLPAVCKDQTVVPG